MGSKMREDEKNERIIRGLLKHPSNRKCINCNLLGPQYVCTTFSTFVCTTCGGIHREFTHRVKSISMAKFTPQEIASLQEGGNERAREIFFKEWDPQRQSAPDTSNVYRLRDFIKHVYVDRRYAGERTPDKPLRGDKEEPTESRRSDGYLSGSRSPPYDDTYERGRASPGYSGVVNDWRRQDRFSNERKSDDQRSSDEEAKSEIRSCDNQKDININKNHNDNDNNNNISSPPVVRPVREILGENVVPLRISEPPKSNSSKVADAPVITQITTSSVSAGNPTEGKRETSLIDFDAQSEPPSTVGPTPTQPSITTQPVTQSASTSSDDNWACFDNIPENNMSQALPNPNSLEFVLTQLSVPSPAPVSGSTNSNNASTPSNDLFKSSSTGDLLFASSASNASTTATPPRVPPAARFSPTSFPRVFGNQGLTGNAAVQPAVPTVEIKSSERKELPVDLFTTTYQPVYYQAPMWQGGVFPGMGYHMQFNPAMAMPSIPQPSKSSNPFAVNAGASSAQAATFPSMGSLHSQLSNTSVPRGVVHAPNFGPMPSWMPRQPSSFGSVMPGGTYVTHQQPTNMAPSRSQGYGGEGARPSLGGNPFG